MRILLRDKVTRRFYCGGELWTEEEAEAVDFGTVEELEELAKRQGSGRMEMVFSYDRPRCDLRVPLGGRVQARGSVNR